MSAGREIKQWVLRPPVAPGRDAQIIWERPSATSILERLNAEAELQSLGRARFTGSLSHRNALWRHYRNFLRQGLSNFRAALGVENRSASLLYYYAMLNFAKAELLSSHSAAVVGFVGHGLRFNVTKAKSVSGDSLTVQDGAFRMLYGERTGYAIPIGTRLPVKRLLGRIPEIADQLRVAKVGNVDVAPMLQLIGLDANSVWVVLAVEPGTDLRSHTETSRYFSRQFREIDPPAAWRDKFGLSRRSGAYDFYESRPSFPYTPGDSAGLAAATLAAFHHTWSVKDILGLSTSGVCDAWISPSLYRSRMLPMPPSIARFAITFYASSLVRYRPSMFDTQVSPEQAYLFDAVARECAVPMLIDTISALSPDDYYFLAEDTFRA